MVLDPCTADQEVEILPPREVPLGGPRAMRVRRTLPQRDRSLIGAWCFLDHYGPAHVADTGGMRVTPHPHTGLQTVSWLFTGEVEHTDSAGNHAMVVPGEVNLMTAGRGISHSEISTERTDLLHGVQLWVALPDDARHVEPGFDHHVPDLVQGDAWAARLFIGKALGQHSPVSTYTPLLGVELLLQPDGDVEVDVDKQFEHGVLVDSGVVSVAGREAKAGELAYVAPGRTALPLAAGEEGARLVLLGGTPFGESIVMWWNFVGRSHEEIVGYREEWQAQITRNGTVVEDSRRVADGRFGIVDNPLPPIPAPPMPHVRLKHRR